MKNDAIAFQGTLGAYSHKACIDTFPKREVLPCKDFAEAFLAVEEGRAKSAMIPIDNSIAGRVADIHLLLPKSDLKIIAEQFIPIHHCLMAVKGAKLAEIKDVYSHVHALPQCRNFINKYQLNPISFGDTAGSAKHVSEMGDKRIAAIASESAAILYNLEVLKKNIEDRSDNVTRFIVLEKTAKTPKFDKDKEFITSLIFKTRNIPAALYKAMGGFATNGVNCLKLESYLEGAKFHSASFYCEIEGHPQDKLCANALEELKFFSEEILHLGTYEKHPYRNQGK